MASTYTANSGIEKIGAGEQAGAWGTTTNNNLDILDRAINGVLSLAISGTTTTITTSDGTLSQGGHKVLSFTGALGADNTVTIDPNDQDKVYIVHNATTDSGSSGPYNVIIRQQTAGSPNAALDVTVPNGSFKIVHCDGGGTNAVVKDVTSTLDISSLKLGGVAVTSTAAELNILDTVTTTAAELNIMDGSATTPGTTAVAASDGIVTNDGGTMQQTTAATFSTYFNSNLVEVKSVATISGALSVIAGGATSVYQRIVVSSGSQTVSVQTDNLVACQYVIIDKTTSANTITINWNAGDGSTALTGGNVSTGISLGTSVDFAIGVFNGTSFSFVESIKF